jgi:beta-lactamase class A
LSIRDRGTAFLPFRSWKLQLAGAAVAVVAAILSAQSLASAREAVATYLIQPGDTLSAISGGTGVAIDRLVTMNGIENPDMILAGHTLSLLGAALQPTNQTSIGQYTVKSGDTLWNVAQTTGCSVDALIQLNGLTNPDQLAVGQVLRLPASAAGSSQQRTAAVTTPKPRPSPTPQPKPAPPSPLQQKVAAEALRVGGSNVHTGVSATNLVNGEKVSLHADDEFPSASVMKLPILVELERQIGAGNLAWTDSLRAEASAMIAISDNSAANQIAGAIHPQSVNDTMAKLGLGGTHFVNLFNDARSASNPGANQTTPSNMARLLELIATDQLVNPQISSDIRGLMARNVDRSKLARLLPPDAQVAHKSGWYEGVADDVGIVTVDRLPVRWVVAVFTEGLPDAETGNQLVAAVSRAIYDAWAPTP